MDSFGRLPTTLLGSVRCPGLVARIKILSPRKKIMTDLDAVGIRPKPLPKDCDRSQSLQRFRCSVPLLPMSVVSTTALVMVFAFHAAGIRRHVIGGALPWFSLHLHSRRSAGRRRLIIQEARRQFKLGVLEGKVEPELPPGGDDLHGSRAEGKLVPLALLACSHPSWLAWCCSGGAPAVSWPASFCPASCCVFMNNAAAPGITPRRRSKTTPRDPKMNLGKGLNAIRRECGRHVGDPFKDTAARR